MIKYLLHIVLFLTPSSALAQVSDNDANSIFKFINNIDRAMSSVLINGFENAGLHEYISVSLISFAVIFLVRSLLEFNVGKVTFNELIINKFLFILLVFSLMDVVLYSYLFEVVQNTADGLGNSSQLIFTGFENFFQLPGSLLFYFLNVSVIAPEFQLLDMVFVMIVIILAALILWRKFLDAGIAIAFFYVFSFIGFKLLYVLGLVVIPLVFISEFRFIVMGFSKAITYMFFFSIIWKLMLGFAAFLIFTAFFGASFLNDLITNNMSMYDFSLQINASVENGRGIPIVINSPLDVVAPLFLLSVATSLISMSFQLTQFILTGFMSVKASFASN